jgi:tetratricopeptide (TPR) repeat protein
MSTDQAKKSKRAKSSGSRGLKGLNTKVFFQTLLVLSALAGAAWALHRIQFSRITGSLRREATEKLEEKDYRSAIPMLERLVALEPKRTDEVVELAEAHFLSYKDQATANLPQIIDRQIAYDSAALNAIAQNPKLADRAIEIKKRMVDKNLQSGRFETGFRLLSSMAGNDPDPWVSKKTAIALLGSRNSGGIPKSSSAEKLPQWFLELKEKNPIDLLLALHAADPGDSELVATLVPLLTRYRSTDLFDGSSLANLSARALAAEAARLVDVLVDSSPSEEAYMLRATLDSRGLFQRRQDLEKVLNLNPERSDALRILVELQTEARRTKQTDPAIVMKPEEVISLLDRIDQLNKERPTENCLLRGYWLTQAEGAVSAAAYWNSQLDSLDRPILVFNALLDLSLEQNQLAQGKQYLQKMIDAFQSPKTQRTPLEQQQEGWLLGQAQAKMAYRDGDIGLATKFLEESGIAGSGEQQKLQWLRLMEGYDQIGLEEKALEAAKQAMSLDPQDPVCIRAYSDQLAKSGQILQAIEQRQSIERMTGSDHLRIAEYLVQQAQQSGPGEVDWGRFERSCNTAQQLIAEANDSTPMWSIDLLRMWAIALRGNTVSPDVLEATLSKRCNELSEAYPDDLECQERLIVFLKSNAPSADSEALWGRLKQINPDHPALAIRTFEKMLTDGQAGAEQFLEEFYKKHPDPAVRRRMITHASLRGRWDDVERYTYEGRRSSEVDSNEIVQTCDLLLLAPPDPALANSPDDRGRLRQQWMEQIAKYETALESKRDSDGFSWRLVRLRRLFQKPTLSAADLKIASDMAVQIEQLRPNWTGNYAIKARLAEANGDVARAIDLYGIAWSRSQLSEELTERYLLLLAQTGRQEESMKVIDKLKQTPIRRRSLNDRIAELTEQSSANVSTEAYLDSLIQLQPNDASVYLLKHNFLIDAARELSGDKRQEMMQDADAMLAKAEELDLGTGGNVVVASIARAHVKGENDKVLSLITRLLSNSSIPAGRRFDMVGRSMRMLGRTEDAIEYLQKAVDNGASRIDLGLAIARGQIDLGQQQQALETFRKLLKDYPDQLVCKQRFLEYLGFLNTPESWEEVRRILNISQPSCTDVDRYFLGTTALAFGDDGMVGEAIKALEASESIRDPENAVQMVLSKLLLRRAKHLRIINRPESEVVEAYQQVIKRLFTATGQEDQVVVLGSQLVQALLADQLPDLASSVIAKLGGLADSGATVARLQARIDHFRKRPSREISESLRVFAGDPSQSVQSTQELQDRLAVARSILALGNPVAGEQLLRQQIESFPGLIGIYGLATSTTTNPEVLATARDFLRGKIKENSGEKQLSAYAIFLSRTESFDSDIPELVAVMGESIADLGADGLALAANLASLLSAKGRQQEALNLLEQQRKYWPNDPSLANNLAMCLAEIPEQSDQALTMSRQFSFNDEIPHSEVLDTRGYVLMRQGQLDEAIRLLRNATTMSNSPRTRLHLATALLAKGEKKEAIRIATGIEYVDLLGELMNPYDRMQWKQLQAEVSGAGGA